MTNLLCRLCPKNRLSVLSQRSWLRTECTSNCKTPPTVQALAPQSGDIHTQSCAVTNDDSTTTITSGAIDNLLGELRHSDDEQLTPRTSGTNAVLFDLPLDYHVPLKLKTKIWSNEYIDFSELLHAKDDDACVMSVKNIDIVCGKIQ